MILNIPGIKYNPNGYINVIKKLVNVDIIKSIELNGLKLDEQLIQTVGEDIMRKDT